MKIFKNSFTDFIVKGIIIYIVWEILYRNFIIYSGFSHFVVEQISYFSRLILDMFYAEVEVKPIGKIFVDGTYAVFVSPDCNALNFMGAFLSFLLAYPAAVKTKLVFGIIMTFLINVFNIIRVVLLTVTALHFNGWFNFNHHYLFNIIIYLLMILSIIYWVKNYADPAKDK